MPDGRATDRSPLEVGRMNLAQPDIAFRRRRLDDDIEVLLVGGPTPPPGVPGAAAVLRPADDGLEQLHATVAGPLRDGRLVVAIHPAWASSERTRALRTLRSSLDTSDLVAVGVDLPPLGLAVAACLIADATRGMDAGSAVAAVGPIADAVRSIGWVGSLKGLPHVSVPFDMHLRSLVPGSAYLVMPTASPQVTRVARGQRLPVPHPEPTLAVVAAAGERGDVGAVDAAMAEAGWSHPTWVETSPDATAWWGTERHVEIAAFPVGDRLGSLVRNAPAGTTCGWCGRRTSSTPCVFCRHATPSGARS